jgi:hypothetical protein
VCVLVCAHMYTHSMYVCLNQRKASSRSTHGRANELPQQNHAKQATNTCASVHVCAHEQGTAHFVILRKAFVALECLVADLALAYLGAGPCGERRHCAPACIQFHWPQRPARRVRRAFHWASLTISVPAFIISLASDSLLAVVICFQAVSVRDHAM